MVDIIKRLKENKEGKVLIKNFGYLSLMELISKFFPLLTTPYLARVLGVDIFGLLAIGTAVVAYFECITNYGFIYTSVREAARHKNNTHELSYIYSVTIYAKILLMVLSIIILLICILFIPFIEKNSLVIICTFLLIPGSVINTDWMFQALEDMKYITIRSVATKIIFTLLVFIFIHKPDDYLWQPILIAIGTFIPSIWGIYVLKERYGIHFLKPTIRDILIQLKDGFNMFVSIFLPTIYTQLNTLFLGYYNGNYATGIYSGGTRFTSLIYSMFQVVSRTVYPFFSRRLDKHQLYTAFSLIFSVIVSIVLFVFSEPLVLFFLGKDFSQTVIVLKIVSITPIAMTLMNCYGFNYLVLQGREDIMRNIIVFITVVGLVLGIWGACAYSYIGVAIASVTTQSLRALLITYYALKTKRNVTKVK